MGVLGRRRGGCVADADLSVLEDVGAETAAVDEGTENGSRGVPLGDPAGFAKPHAAAAHVTDHEVAPDEGVELDTAGDQVAAVLVGPQGGWKDSQTSASMRVSALPGSPEGKVPVPVTWRSPARRRPVSACTAGQAQGWFARGCGDPDPFDRAVRDGSARRAWEGERDVGGSDDEPVLDPVAAHLRVVCGIPGNPGGDAVHDDIAGLPACGRADPGEPGSRPGERHGLGDAGDT